jgi:hypothetical protein
MLVRSVVAVFLLALMPAAALAERAPTDLTPGKGVDR